LLLPLMLYTQRGLAQWSVQGEPHLTPQQIEKQLSDAEVQLREAKEMFNPWYTGPLLTPSASMMPPGYGNIQPYVFVSGTYAGYDANRHAVGLTNNLYQLKSSNILQFGITNTMDIVATFTVSGAWKNNYSGGGFGDIPITIGFPITPQTVHVPQMKITIQQVFPTGSYQNLNHNGLNLSATGQGAYQTQFGYAISKLFLWSRKHPFNTRFYIGYTLATPVHVKGFNAYGGGFGTHGVVRPGNTLSTDLGLELSLTQAWVLACDIAYTASNRTKFSGNPGTTAAGTPASVGGGSNDNLSIAPAIEYNWSGNLGILGGAWFSVYGRNSSAFVQGILSVAWTFPVN
jgi:hypothetical protein